MISNKRRRSSDDCSSARPSPSKFAFLSSRSIFVTSTSSAPMLAPTPRRAKSIGCSPLTPRTVTLPSVSVTDSTTMQSERDRCRSPIEAASTYLAKVAVVSSIPGTSPTSPRSCGGSRYSASTVSSTRSTPASTPDEEPHYSFLDGFKVADASSAYISFPVFEDFGGNASDEEDDDERLGPVRRASH